MGPPSAEASCDRDTGKRRVSVHKHARLRIATEICISGLGTSGHCVSLDSLVV